jgi:hypothetical protein
MPDAIGEDGSLDPRSISADRHNIFVKEVGLGPGLGLSSRSSASSLSGFSGLSTSTYFHENSTLVIESVENHVKKYAISTYDLLSIDTSNSENNWVLIPPGITSFPHHWPKRGSGKSEGRNSIFTMTIPLLPNGSRGEAS